MRQNAMLEPLRSILARFSSLFGTLLAHETLQNEVGDPIEKITKFWYPFLEFLRDLGPPWRSKKGPKRFRASTLLASKKKTPSRTAF